MLWRFVAQVAIKSFHYVSFKVMRKIAVKIVVGMKQSAAIMTILNLSLQNPVVHKDASFYLNSYKQEVQQSKCMN